MKPLKKHILLALTSAVMILCLCFGLVACKDKNKDNGPTAFSAPANVTVTDDTLSWDAVDGAAEYTVKINDDETTKVPVNSLDLKTVTAKLKEGANTLSVKVNATEEKEASEYSESVNYNYTKPVTPQAFTAPANLAVVEGEDKDTLTWDAAEGAAEYTVKINSDETTKVTTNSLDLSIVTSKLVQGKNTLSVKVNATADKNASPYSATVEYTYEEGSEQPPIVKEAFATPANVAVAHGTLTWDEVDGAAEYTVKINSDETTTVTTNSLDLSTVISKLVEGKNTLSVKVNATEEKDASAYSDTVSLLHYLPFDAPENVKIENDILTWDAVAGATEGYTVRINIDETTQVSTNSLDLKTVSAKLASGVNKIYVSANAVGDKPGGKESAVVEYNYVPSVETEINDYKALVDAIGTITENSDAQEAPAIAAAIKAAETKYNGLSAEAKESADVIAAKATFDEKKAVYDEIYGAADELFQTFSTALLATLDEIEKEESLTALNEKVTAVTAVYNSMNALAKSLLLDNQKTQYAGLATSVAEWTAAVNTAKTEWTVTFETPETDAVAEANIVKANALLAKYSEYKAYVKAGIAAEYETVNAALSAAQTKVQTTVNAIKTTVTAFTGTIASEKVTQEYLAELNGYKAQVEDFDAYANTLWTAELTEKLTNEIEALETAIARKNAIAAALSEINAVYDALTEDDEEIIAAVSTFETQTYATYADYIKDDEGINTVYGKLTAKSNTAKNNIRATVNAIKTAAEAAIANDSPNETNYAALEEQRDAIEGVTGAYATQYLTTLKIGEDDVITAVVKAMNTMLTRVMSSIGGEAYSLTGTTLKITLFRTFFNFRDEKIAVTDGANAPKLTTECDSLEGGNKVVDVEQDFAKNDLNEYVGIVIIRNLGAMGNDPAYVVTVGNDSVRTSVNFGETIGDNPYFTNDNEVIDEEETGFKKAITEINGTYIFNMEFQGGCTAEHYYLEVYNANAIIKDGAFVKFTEMPLGKIEVTDQKNKDKMTIEQFNRFIANDSVLGDIFIGKSLNVRFMIYGTSNIPVTDDNGDPVTDENGAPVTVPAFTAMNASVISEAIKFNLVEEDKYYKLPVANLWDAISTNDERTMALVVDDRKSEIIDAVNASLADAKVTGTTLTADNYTHYLQMKIEVYDAADENQAILRTKYIEIGPDAISVKAIIEEWQKEYFTEHGNVEEPSYRIGIRIAYCIKPDTAISQYFPRAVSVETKRDGVKYEENITLSKADFILPNTGLKKSDNDYFIFLRDEKGADGYVGNGKILSQGDALYLEIKFYVADGEKETNVNYAYLFKEENNATLYKNKEDAGKDNVPKLGASVYWDSGIPIGDGLKNFFRDNYTVNGYPLRWDDGWSFTARYVLNPESENYLFEGGWSTPIVFETKSKPMSTDAQITFDDTNFVFFSAFGEGENRVDRGEIFTTGGVDKVELHFYQLKDEVTEETTQYSIDVIYNRQTGEVELYYGKTKITSTLNGSTATDAWVTPGKMADIINEYLEGIESDDTFTGEWHIYTVTHLREGSKVFSGGDENGNVKSDEYTYTHTV